MVIHMYNTSIPELRGPRQKGETFEITQVSRPKNQTKNKVMHKINFLVKKIGK